MHVKYLPHHITVTPAIKAITGRAIRIATIIIAENRSKVSWRALYFVLYSLSLNGVSFLCSVPLARPLISPISTMLDDVPDR
jgi:hypothetical protein